MNDASRVQPADVDTRSSAQGRFRPAIDILEGPQSWTVLADMPGSSVDDIDVQFQDGLLTIRGRVADRAPQGGRPVAQEYGVGDYEHTLRLGEQVDATAISAQYQAGVLTLRLPKAAAHQTRKIPVAT